MSVRVCVCVSICQEVIRQNMDERKPGENVDTSQWKDTIMYERSEGEYFPGTRVSGHLLLSTDSLAI